jgi:hypothetical protein
LLFLIVINVIVVIVVIVVSHHSIVVVLAVFVHGVDFFAEPVELGDDELTLESSRQQVHAGIDCAEIICFCFCLIAILKVC